MRPLNIIILTTAIVAIILLSCKNSDHNPTRLNSPGKIRFAGREERINYILFITGNYSEPEVLIQSAGIAFECGDISLTESLLNRYFKSENDNPEAYYLSAAVQFARKNYPLTLKYLRLASLNGFNNFELNNMLAESYFQISQFDSAQWALGSSTEKYNDKPELLNLMGKISLARLDTMKSIEYFRKCLKLNPYHSESLDNLVNIYSSRKDWKRSVEILEERLIHDNNLQLKEQLVTMYIASKSYRSADSLLRTFPRTGNNFFKNISLAEIYFDQLLYDSAIIYSQRAMDFDQKNSRALYFKGKSLERKNENYQALGIFEQLLIMDSTNVDVKKEIDFLNRKIAYLRKIQQERETEPVFKLLESIKIKN